MIAEVSSTENKRQKYRGRPEADPPRHGEEPVATKSKFFAQRDGKESSAPSQSPTEDCVSRKFDRVNLKVAGNPQQQQDSRKHREAPDRTLPKSSAECLPGRNAVFIEGPLLDSRQNPRRQGDKKRHDRFERQLTLHGQNAFPAFREMESVYQNHRNRERNSDPDEQPGTIDAPPGRRLLGAGFV